MNKITIPALAITMAAGTAMGATTVKSVNDLASSINVATPRGAANLDALSLQTLNGGESINGDTSTSSDDMDNGSLGGGGSWNGGDDVYSLQWGGGDITIDLFFSKAAGTSGGDLDLYLLDGPGSGFASTSVTDDESIVVAGLAAGKYWIVVDGWAGAGNSYKLAVSPTPGAAAVFGLAGIAAAGRRRR